MLFILGLVLLVFSEGFVEGKKPPEEQLCADPNAEPQDYPSACQPTCSDRRPPESRPCTKNCLISGCVCKSGYILDKTGGKCIEEDSCPLGGNSCDGDRNATRVSCATVCPSTCASQSAPKCLACLVNGCECKKGYIREERNGPCIKLSDCPRNQCADPNAEPQDCPSACQPTCSDQRPPESRICTKNCLASGCVCKSGYILDKTEGKCIEEDSCPLGGCSCDGDRNATRVSCASVCPSTCASPSEPKCQACIDNGCACKKGYIREETNGPCVKPSDCPSKQCADPNAERQDCPSACQPTCSDRRPPGSRPCTLNCLISGCVCKSGYILDKTGGKCIEEDSCPLGGNSCDGDRNATRVSCASVCPATCGSQSAFKCQACTSNGCECKNGYIRQENNGPCIKPSDCPRNQCADPNAEPQDCPSACQPTCSDRRPPESRICTKNCLASGCVCKSGYILDKTEGKCIEEDSCPLGGNSCDGDRNATRVSCASACPSTCASPSGSKCQACIDNGCACKKGYIREETNGPCVKPSDCPSKQCADPNAERQDCPSACQPTCSDRRPPGSRPCTLNCLISGCVCKSGYILDKTGGKCIEEDSCPLGGNSCDGDRNATRVSCASLCPATCGSHSAFKCQACTSNGCECKNGYIRMENKGPCIKPSDCPPQCFVPDSCKRTCANPNPDNCVYEPSETNIDGCNCMEGYILSDVKGKCIKIEECLSDVACKGDPNAVATNCPSPCPATCDSPNEKSCKKQCEPVGCECRYDYILNADTGLCVLPDNCPSGNPCGSNERFVSCKSGCPTNYCSTSDSRAILICDPPPREYCLAGCICNLNYRRNSIKDPRCIVSSKCRPVKCTRPNEVYDRYANGCVKEDCSDYGNDPVQCNELVLNNNPRCVCKKGYYRNATDICIPGNQCPPTESID